MSDLFGKHEYPLVIDHPIGGRRLVAEIFPLEEGGILFFDSFWPGSSRNPIHQVPGEISGEGPWTVGDSTLFLIDEENPEYNSLWAEFFLWCEAQQKDSDIKHTVNNREFVLQMARSEGAQV